jgi:hypothetical protein
MRGGTRAAIAHGEFRFRSYEDGPGTNRTGASFVASKIGPDMLLADLTVARARERHSVPSGPNARRAARDEQPRLRVRERCWTAPNSALNRLVPSRRRNTAGVLAAGGAESSTDRASTGISAAGAGCRGMRRWPADTSCSPGVLASASRWPSRDRSMDGAALSAPRDADGARIELPTSLPGHLADRHPFDVPAQ